jgi:hypothetical protein
MHFDLSTAVLQLVGGTDGFKSEFTFFSDWDTTQPQFVGDCGSEQESARIDPDDL